MQLKFANRPAIIVECNTQYLSHNLRYLGGRCNTPPTRLLIRGIPRWGEKKVVSAGSLIVITFTIYFNRLYSKLPTNKSKSI